ncbi:MAG TPA: alpha/beta fold hydrolase [Microlunatus sp.]
MEPAVEPYDSGLLTVADGSKIYWEASGNPKGRPALYLHGGPGGPLGAGYRRRFDADRFLIVGMDQRGSGRSRPLASEDLGSLAINTTTQLLADTEELRAHLGIDHWLVHGVSWGTTLAIAYAVAHPDRVTGVVLTGVGVTSPRSVEWITETIGMLFPIEWERFEHASRRQTGERIVDAFHRLLTQPGLEHRRRAAAEWCRWEGVHMSLGPGLDDSPLFEDEPDLQLLFATLVTHYWSHDGFLDHDRVLAQIPTLAGIPCVMIHGRHDVSGPAGFAYEIKRAWPGSELILVDEGHGGPQMMELTTEAIARLGGTP